MDFVAFVDEVAASSALILRRLLPVLVDSAVTRQPGPPH
jgi:hypothetical protein